MKEIFLLSTLFLAAILTSSFLPPLSGANYFNLFLVVFLYFILLISNPKYLIAGVVLSSFVISFPKNQIFFMNILTLSAIILVIKITEKNIFTKLNLIVIGFLSLIEIAVLNFSPLIFNKLVDIFVKKSNFTPFAFDIKILYEAGFVIAASLIIFEICGSRIKKSKSQYEV